jgi:hypothetical protein
MTSSEEERNKGSEPPVDEGLGAPKKYASVQHPSHRQIGPPSPLHWQQR